MDYADDLLTEVQDPVQRPQAVPRPSGSPPQSRAQRSYADDLLETQPPAQAPSEARQTGIQAEPDAPTWFGRRVQDIRGKQDPRYKDIPTIAEVTIKEGINKPVSESAAWLAGTSDKGMVPTYNAMLGDRFLGQEVDANGYPIVLYRGQDGSPQRAYVNKPGLDMQDVVRGGMSVAPFVGAGRGIGALKAIKEAPLVGRMLAQFGGQAATSVAQDVANTAMGGDDLNLVDTGVKAAVTGAAGAGGEALGAAAQGLYRRFVAEPRLFNRATGELTQEGAQAAQQAGLNPAGLSTELRKQFAQELARTGKADQAAGRVANAEFGIPKTRGELTQDMPTLLREQHIRGGNYGEQGAQIMQDFDKRQQSAIVDALTGDINGRPGIAQRIAPARAAQDYGKAEMGAAIRQNTEQAFETAKTSEREAWKGVTDLRPTEEAMPLLKQRLNEAIGEFPIPPNGKAELMERELDAFMKGQAPAKVSEWRDANPIGNIDQMRKRLTTIVRTTEDPTDKAAAVSMLDGFNNWIRDAAEQSLLKGDPQAAANMVTARGISREIHQIFDGQQGTPGARILQQVLKKADSAEEVVNALFSGPTAQIKAGTIPALQNLKQAYDKYLPADAAKAAWDDIRLANFLRLVQNKSGEPYGVQQIQSNIKQFLSTQASVARTLHPPEEIAMLTRFVRATVGIEKKNPNKPWSGIAAGGIIKDMVGSLISAFGFNSILAKTGMNMAGGQIVKKAYGPAAAAQATSGNLPALPAPSWGGYGGALGSRSQD